MDQDNLIARIENGDPAELAGWVQTASGSAERVLRAYFGTDRFEHLRRLTAGATRQVEALTGPRGNVVVIPGLMGSTLTAENRDGWRGRVWLDPWRLHRGGIAYLRLDEDGRRAFDPQISIEATGLLTWFYGELLVTLGQNWNARAFWFDWRQDLEVTADALRKQVDTWFGPEEPFHIVAHSMGGLVARAFLKNHAARWQMAAPQASGGRLVMLGTPNHGAFLIPQALTGLAQTVQLLERLDGQHDREDVLAILHTFPGLYQMMPSPRVLPAVEPLYRAESYAGLCVSQRHLDRARTLHDQLATVIDPARMIYLAGFGQPTVTGIRNVAALNDLDSYTITRDGDGSVPLALGPLRTPDGAPAAVPTYYYPVEHSALTSNDDVLMSVDEALRTGACGAAVRPERAAAALGRLAPSVTTQDDPEARRLWLARRETNLRRASELDATLQYGPGDVRSALEVEARKRELGDMIGPEILGTGPGSIFVAGRRRPPDEESHRTLVEEAIQS